MIMYMIIATWIILVYLNTTVHANCNITSDMLGYKEAQCQDQGFTSVPINLPPDIKKLDLSYNRLARLGANSFHRYKYLEHLILDYNLMNFMDAKAFIGLSLLRRLSMVRNELNLSTSYQPGVFESLQNLSALDVSRNMNTSNHSDKYNIPVGELCNLRELSMDLVLNATFGEQFKKLHNLQTLRFDYCYGNFLYNETFLDMPVTIKEFHMTTCKHFVVVESGVLIPFPHLKVLNLTNSNIHLKQALSILHPFQNKSMDAILFRGLTRGDFNHGLSTVILTPETMKCILTICIKTLDVSDNEIISVEKGSFSFKYPECFENVMVSANSFSLDNWAFDFFRLLHDMTNIKMFDFSYFPLRFKNAIFLDVVIKNNHTTIQRLEDRHRLERINITIMIPKQIQFIRITHLMGRHDLSEIQAFNSSLRHFEVSYFETDDFPVFSFKGYNSLEHLDLSGIRSDITIGAGKIPVLIHLKTLILKETKLYNILETKTSILSFCPNIRNLDISYNYMWKINSLGKLPYLKHLNLSHNLLHTVPDVVTMFDSLTELDLSYNQLTTIQIKIRNWIDIQHNKIGTFKLYISNNPLICSCDTKSFLRWILTTKVNLDKNGNYSCWVSSIKTINYTRNVAEDFHHYFVDCDTTVWIKLGISLLVSVLSSLICITLLYNFRWRIVFFFFRNCRRFAEKGLELTFDYDVYVSYSDDCISFVKELQKKVEDDWGFKICFEDRDFVVGGSIATERASFIHRCRHVIFLVSPSIVENEWTRFEIERAKYEKFSKNLQKIVVIARDIPLDDIPVEFSTIWKDVLLIQWPDEQDEVQIAWQKLRLWFF